MVTHSSVVEFSVVMQETWVRVRVSTLLRSFHCDTTLYSYVEASKNAVSVYHTIKVQITNTHYL